MTELTPELIEELQTIDTPTVCNALELLAPERRGYGFTVRPLVCPRPELPPIVAVARTVTIRAAHPSHLKGTEARDLQHAYYTYVDEGPKPSVMLIQDLDGDQRGYGSWWGEVNSNIHRALGCVGTIIDGAIRDVDEMCNAGFKALARRLSVGHAYSTPIRWDGEVESTIAGSYAFHVAGSEGARLWVNGRSLIDRWINQSEREHSGIIHLEGRQRYPVRLEYFEADGDAAVHLFWTPPQGEKAVIPGGQLSHFPAQEPMRNGLLGSYHRGSNFKGDAVERIDRTIDFSWVDTGPVAGFGINYFSVRWEGEVEAPISGPVTFRATTDDGVRLWVGGQLIIDEWRPREAAESRSEIVMEAGRRYPIRMDYYQATKSALARLSWSGPALQHSNIWLSAMYCL